MKVVKNILIFSLAIFFVAGTNSYAEIIIIVHPDNTADISEKYLERMFLGKSKSFPDGSPSIPINLMAGSDDRVYFDEKVLSKSPSQMKAYWSQLIFTGKATPIQEVETDLEVIELVSKNPSAIGYIKAESMTDGVKKVLSFD